MPETPLTTPPPLPKSQPSFGKRYRTIIKLVGVGVLILLLLIPLGMISGVLRDRLERRNEAVADITSSWGKQQCVIGPVLGIPYLYKYKTVKEITGLDGKVEKREVEETATAIAYFLPEALNITGDAETQMLHRGIYLAAALGVIHYYWLVKSDIRKPVFYGVLVGLLLAWRAWSWTARKKAPSTAPATEPTAARSS